MLIAIRRKNTEMVRMLVEWMESVVPPGVMACGSAGDETGACKGLSLGYGIRCAVEYDGVITPSMLRVAVQCGAQDIVEYFTRQKRCIPDMQTLLMMQ